MDIDLMRSDFERAFNKSLSLNRTFDEQMRRLFEILHWNSATFSRYTTLNRNMYRRLITPGQEFGVRIIVTVCFAALLNVGNTVQLLNLAGRSLSPVKRAHCAYLHVLEHFGHMKIDEVNEILTGLGLHPKDLLGGQFKD